MNNSKPRHNNWDPCHPGLIHEAAQDIAVSRRRLFRILGAGVAVGAVSIGAGWGLLLSDGKQKSSQSMPAGIACITVVNHMPDFFSGQIDDKNLKKRITSHIWRCARCRRIYDDMRCGGKFSGCGMRPVKATLKPCTVRPPSP